MWYEIKRKAFHLFSLTYVVGLIFIPRPAYLGFLTGLTALVFIVEMSRLRIPSVNAQVKKVFGALMRPHEDDHLSGLFWMMLGMTITVALVKPVPVAATAMLYLIIGDAIASLIGIRFGGPPWPGQKKRISGSLACFAVCVVIGQALLRPEYGWSGVLAGAAAAAIVEIGLVPIDDNLAIPVASSLILMLSYGLTPGF